MSGDVEITRHRVDLREQDGVGDLAVRTCRHAVGALRAGHRSLYAHPGVLVIGEGEPLFAACHREWAIWRDHLCATLGHAVLRRALRASGRDLAAELGWRGVLILDGQPVAWQAWTPGESHLKHGPGTAPTMVDLETIAGNLETGESPLTWSSPQTFEEVMPLGEARLPVLARGSSRVIGYSLIDRSSEARALRHVWEIDQFDPSAYIVVRGSGGMVRLHSFIMKGPAGKGRSWHHANLNRWDNRRSNLVPATPTKQLRERGVRSDSLLGTKGVKRRKDGRYEARISIGGKRRTLGYFATEGEASAAYAAAVRERDELSSLTPET